ncbi:MAG: Nramp family divalent metal transporter [Saprospiraceae bacterium]|nr:Nramp family divalent metal transporter [Saprospiraceae bacterium]
MNNSYDTKRLLRTIGPGLLFASSSIGTSHLVLSTRAGAHHGFVFVWIILAALLIKYPFFEFGPRYALATGDSIIRGYQRQGKWAVLLFFCIVCVSMFAVVGALSAVSGGLLGALLGSANFSQAILVPVLMLVTAIVLLVGRYKLLDNLIKVVSVVLLVTVCIAFVAVVSKGPVEPMEGFQGGPPLLEGAGLVLLVGLVGWMPSGMTASVLNSIWVVEKIKTSGYRPTLREGMFDFRFGYIFTVILAFMFLAIGTYTVYGSGQLLEGSSGEFTQRLLSIFTEQLGEWTYPIISLAAFATIYGTLITAWDAFARGCSRSLSWLDLISFDDEDDRQRFWDRSYLYTLSIIGVGAYLLFSSFTGGMIAILEVATIISFLMGPIISFLNLRAINSAEVPPAFRPSKRMNYLAYLFLSLFAAFAIYYVFHLVQHGVAH